MAVSTALAKPCQFTSFVFHRARRWVTEGVGTWQLTANVMSRWSDPWSSPTAHSALVAHVLLTMVTSGVLSPPVARLTCVVSPLLRMLAYLEISQSSNVSPRWSAGWCSSQREEWALRSPAANLNGPTVLLLKRAPWAVKCGPNEYSGWT